MDLAAAIRTLRPRAAQPAAPWPGTFCAAVPRDLWRLIAEHVDIWPKCCAGNRCNCAEHPALNPWQHQMISEYYNEGQLNIRKFIQNFGADRRSGSIFSKFVDDAWIVVAGSTVFYITGTVTTFSLRGPAQPNQALYHRGKLTYTLPNGMTYSMIISRGRGPGKYTAYSTEVPNGNIAHSKLQCGLDLHYTTDRRCCGRYTPSCASTPKWHYAFLYDPESGREILIEKISNGCCYNAHGMPMRRKLDNLTNRTSCMQNDSR